MLRKKAIWKPKLFRLGLLLTLLVMALDWRQKLEPVENLLSDRLRARYCHRFTPPPTDRIVHLDIDDDTLNEIGAWPWAREKLARIIDEVSRAKPKVIGMDMYFPDPQDDGSRKREDGTIDIVP